MRLPLTSIPGSDRSPIPFHAAPGWPHHSLVELALKRRADRSGDGGIPEVCGPRVFPSGVLGGCGPILESLASLPRPVACSGRA